MFLSCSKSAIFEPFKIICKGLNRYIVNNTGLTIHLDGYYLAKIPIPKISKTDQQAFINLANKILTAKKTNQDSSDLEAQIDKLVYPPYDLTVAEIKIIETSE